MSHFSQNSAVRNALPAGPHLYRVIIRAHVTITFAELRHREMKGFPNITTGNDAILARYDNTLVDAKPWGHGQERGGAEWVCAGQPLDHALHLVDGRHPLAAAQFINHPPPGAKPNVLLAPFDLLLADGALPAVRCVHSRLLVTVASSAATGLYSVRSHYHTGSAACVVHRTCMYEWMFFSSGVVV